MLLLFTAAGSAQAAQALTPLTARLQYQAAFGGLPVGQVGLDISQQPQSAAVALDVTTTGLLKVFVKHSSHTTFEATGKNFAYPDRVYETRYRTRKKSRHVKLVYKKGALAQQLVEPPQDNRPPVPDADKNSAYDLLYFLLRMRTELSDTLAGGKKSFTMQAYDGRRLSRADFTVIGDRIILLAGKKQAVTAISARRTPLAGFTPSELADVDPKEPALTIYFSKDTRLLPLLLEFPLLGQKLTIALANECGARESCLLGNSE